jgi:hypothetical protein
MKGEFIAENEKKVLQSSKCYHGHPSHGATHRENRAQISERKEVMAVQRKKEYDSSGCRNSFVIFLFVLQKILILVILGSPEGKMSVTSSRLSLSFISSSSSFSFSNTHFGKHLECEISV